MAREHACSNGFVPKRDECATDRPNRPSVDNALRASWRPLNGDRFTLPYPSSRQRGEFRTVNGANECFRREPLALPIRRLHLEGIQEYASAAVRCAPWGRGGGRDRQAQDGVGTGACDSGKPRSPVLRHRTREQPEQGARHAQAETVVAVELAHCHSVPRGQSADPAAECFGRKGAGRDGQGTHKIIACSSSRHLRDVLQVSEADLLGTISNR